VNFQLVLIKPEGFDFVEALREVIDVLQEGLMTLGHSVVLGVNEIVPNAQAIIFGAHHLDEESIARLPTTTIIYNLEQLVPGYPWYSEAYLNLLARFQVWDYSSDNVATLSRGARRLPVLHVPFGYSPCLTRIAPIADEDVDVLFFGVHTERRLSVLQAIADRGFKVACLRNVWGAERDGWIARAKVVVAIRQTDDGAFENVRVIFLLANAKAVVAEMLPGELLPAPLRGALCAVTYDELTDTCARLVYDADQRATLCQQAKSAVMADALQALPSISRAIQGLILVRFDDHLRDMLYQASPAYRALEAKPPLDLAFERFAFYLPQFHRCPENDRYWGAGFTEWNSVSRALPRFAGHYQPRLPGELGYYDLAAEHVLPRQVALARNYGLTGFMFFFYWLEGKPVLEKPIMDFFTNKSLDMKFFFMWANENWTRRWDGAEQEVLLRQTYSVEQTRAMISHMIPYFIDQRYLKVGKRPVLSIYRADLIPDIAIHLSIMTQACIDAGLDKPYLIMALSFANTDPAASQFDAALEYPPHPSVRARTVVAKDIREQLQSFDPGFNGNVFHYDAKVASELAVVPPPFRVYRTAFPSWDNSARRRKGGSWTFTGASPVSFARWLDHLCQQESVMTDDLRMVCINAWNEWGEGAYLEPDARFGYAYLDAMYETFASMDRRRSRFIDQRRK
jgi:Glycosyltransferase WbsX